VDATTSYGFVAFNSGTCGDCYELDFTGQSNSQGSGDPGSQQLCGKKMIVQVVNIGSIGANQFDIMIPGGGVGANNACSTEWGVSNSALGEQYGGIMSTCQQQSSNYATYSACTKAACTTLFANSSEAELLAGCNWFTGWFGNADNPSFKYTKVTCPAALNAQSPP
jgi:Glycosyl hydrolase family 45